MPFSHDVAERALLDCGRHCCICHKFCGSKMELHHIVPEAEGGEDTYENCVPLCFDCHAEVKAYNPKHPKGRKYTESELRGHRDRWYEKVRNSHAVTTNPDYVELDRKLFLEIREIIPSTGSISFVRSQDYGLPFPREKHEDIRSFLSHSTKPEFEFIDIDLEGLRVNLVDSVREFLMAIGQYTFDYDRRDGWSSVPRDWAYRQREQFHQARKKLNALSYKVCESYDELIRLGRRKLGV
jgi:hypothetical protein